MSLWTAYYSILLLSIYWVQETGPGLDAEFKWSVNNEKLANKPLKKEVWGVAMEDNTDSVSVIVSNGCYSHSHEWKGNNKRKDIFM